MGSVRSSDRCPIGTSSASFNHCFAALRAISAPSFGSMFSFILHSFPCRRGSSGLAHVRPWSHRQRRSSPRAPPRSVRPGQRPGPGAVQTVPAINPGWRRAAAARDHRRVTGAARGRRRRTADHCNARRCGLLGTLVIGRPSSASIQQHPRPVVPPNTGTRGRCSGPRRPGARRRRRRDRRARPPPRPDREDVRLVERAADDRDGVASASGDERDDDLGSLGDGAGDRRRPPTPRLRTRRRARSSIGSGAAV